MSSCTFNIGDIVEFIPEKLELVRPEFRSYCIGRFEIVSIDHDSFYDSIEMKSVDGKSNLDGKYCRCDCFRLASTQSFEVTDEDLASLLEDEA